MWSNNVRDRFDLIMQLPHGANVDHLFAVTEKL